MIKSSLVPDFIRDNNGLFWKIRHQNEKGFMITSYPTEGETVSLDGSLVYLQRVLSGLMPGRYFIEAWQNEGQKKEWNKTFFFIDGNGEANPVSQAFSHNNYAIGNLPEESIETKIAKALDSYKRDQEIESLKAKVILLESEKKELELEIESSQQKIMKRLTPYLPELMEGLGFTKGDNAIAGNDNTLDIDSEKLSKNLKEWYDIDDEMPEIVEKILNLAKSDKSTYGMAKNMLIKK